MENVRRGPLLIKIATKVKVLQRGTINSSTKLIRPQTSNSTMALPNNISKVLQLRSPAPAVSIVSNNHPLVPTHTDLALGMTSPSQASRPNSINSTKLGPVRAASRKSDLLRTTDKALRKNISMARRPGSYA
jgi:hypothetical protein